MQVKQSSEKRIAHYIKRTRIEHQTPILPSKHSLIASSFLQQTPHQIALNEIYWSISSTGVRSITGFTASATASTTCENLSLFKYSRSSSFLTISANSSTMLRIDPISAPCSHRSILNPFKHKWFCVRYDAVTANGSQELSLYVTTVQSLSLSLLSLSPTSTNDMCSSSSRRRDRSEPAWASAGPP